MENKKQEEREKKLKGKRGKWNCKLTRLSPHEGRQNWGRMKAVGIDLTARPPRLPASLFRTELLPFGVHRSFPTPPDFGFVAAKSH